MKVDKEKIKELATRFNLKIINGGFFFQDGCGLEASTKCGCPMFILACEKFKSADEAVAKIESLWLDKFSTFDIIANETGLPRSFILGFTAGFDNSYKNIRNNSKEYEDGYNQGREMFNQLKQENFSLEI